MRFFYLEAHRGKGLGKWLIEYIVTYPELKGLHHILLATLDAHELYHRYGGFTNLRSPDKFMVYFPPERRKALGL